MESAARLGDGSAHGGAVEGASGTVEVNGRGAARLGDPHHCPMVIPYPHVGGSIRFGGGAALTVLINNQPAAARLGTLECVKAPLLPANVIMMGSGTVFYGVTSTLCGLPVVENPDGTLQIGKNIVIKGDAAYQALLLADLAEIASTEIGRKRLLERERSKHKLTIIPWDKPARNAEARASGPGYDSGAGCDSTVAYSPGIWPPSPGAAPVSTGATRDVILFHELTHAEHHARGNMDNTPRSDGYDDQEEFNTIEPDENDYRHQRGISKERHTHHGI